ncbi:MAG TPA: YbaB/EbfC family nucleoid-associated protein [Pseudonocardiaceae bacterium]|nr:YbaB/EbfC family nucleoid-associated protein [Pseudonocardiaceae bacterium]
MTTPGEKRASLEARTAAMRENVDGLLADFEKRTAQLREAQQAAAALTAKLASPDGTVRIAVDATGMLTELHLTPNAFNTTRPDQLARTISDLVRRGTIQVRRQAAELLRPVTEGLPDLSNLAEGVPSLNEMLPKIPEYPAPQPPPMPPQRPGSIMTGPPPRPPEPQMPPMPPMPARASGPPTRRQRPAARDDEEMPSSWMKDDDL